MSGRATIADVARAVGVHPATVSRALNPKASHQVNPVTLSKVRAAAKRLGYVPNSIARGLRTSSSMTVGVMVPDLTNPIFPPMVRGIESHLAPLGYSAFVVNTDGSDALERSHFESLVQRQVDGFIFATGHDGASTVAEAYRRGVKGVLMNRTSADAPYPAVLGDDANGIRAALGHLAALGHRRIAHIAGPEDFSTGRIRAEAFVAGCAELGIAGTIEPSPAYSVEAGRAATDRILAGGAERPTAIVAGNDLLALGAYHALRSHGLNCPGDVSVVGFNDMPFAGDFEPAMTTIRTPYLALGSEAARLLVEQIETSGAPMVRVVLPVELVVRASTAIAVR